MFKVLTAEGDLPPKAIVIMYGWLGSQMKHIEKYARLYVQRNCTVVYGNAHSAAIMFRAESELTKVVLESVTEAAKILRNLESQETPVIMHYFSNGGAFLAERFEQMVVNMNDEASSKLSDSSYADLIYVATRLKEFGFEIADSAPAYLHTSSGLKAIDTSVSNVFIRTIFRSIFGLSVFVKDTVLKPCNEETTRETFWKNVVNSTLCKKQAFIYSATDVLTDHEKIDELIQERKSRGILITAKKLDESEHVLHLRNHPEIYNELIGEVIESVSSSSS
ncbi:hypothetical protein CTEN210_08028 [Chaetoceros tenuissimus]|uniref:Uncharacterized protein n=1 Tax=Chaetoceros tenuissimus TaxID=426638 RepID=A0AAD3CST6_9STRA|nr:hypothetical protein CTEN210_08028 [Chaetoceros tenuissimus]